MRSSAKEKRRLFGALHPQSYMVYIRGAPPWMGPNAVYTSHYSLEAGDDADALDTAAIACERWQTIAVFRGTVYVGRKFGSLRLWWRAVREWWRYREWWRPDQWPKW